MDVKITVDGLFIRSLLCSFYFKLFPEIIQDGRLFIAEPPLYRVDDKKNPFAINRGDYNNRYIRKVMKAYKIGIPHNNDVEWFDKESLNELLSDTTNYVDDIITLSKHYLVNDRLIEIIIEELSDRGYDPDQAKANPVYISSVIKNLDIQLLMNRIGLEFVELLYDYDNNIIKGPIDGKYQSLEITPRLLRKSGDLIRSVSKYCQSDNKKLVLRDIQNGTEHHLSLLAMLKILRKYQPMILHRFKGLGENDDEDIKETIMDPNTRSLIRLNISDMENDMRIFQMLRGTSPSDASARKSLMSNYTIPLELIDT